jgi:hypothetical protein
VAGRAYDHPQKRRSDIIGIIVNGDVVTGAFARQGWRWGGIGKEPSITSISRTMAIERCRR